MNPTSTPVPRRESQAPKLLSMQIQLVNIVRSQEEILSTRKPQFLQASIKGITIHFLPNRANAPWEAPRPGIKAFTPLIRSSLSLNTRNTNSQATLQSTTPSPRALGPGRWHSLSNRHFPKKGLGQGPQHKLSPPHFENNQPGKVDL